MSTTHAVDFGGIHVRGAWADPDATVTVELAVYTKAGQARLAALDEKMLLQIITESSRALDVLRQRRSGLQRPAPRLSGGDLRIEGPGGAPVLPR